MCNMFYLSFKVHRSTILCPFLLARSPLQRYTVYRFVCYIFLCIYCNPLPNK